MIDFVCDDVLSWAKNYKGDKFTPYFQIIRLGYFSWVVSGIPITADVISGFRL